MVIAIVLLLFMFMLFVDLNLSVFIVISSITNWAEAETEFYEWRVRNTYSGGGEKSKVTVWELERGDDGSDEAEGIGRGDGWGECSRRAWAVSGRNKEEVGVQEERDEK